MKNRSLAYLQSLPNAPNWPRWSIWGDVLEWPDGSTVLFSAEVALFLEGYASVGPLIHFAHIVQILLWLDDQKGEATAAPPDDFPDLHQAKQANQIAELSRRFRANGRPLRNAGALCASVCRKTVPAIAGAPELRELDLFLGNESMRVALGVPSLPGGDDASLPNFGSNILQIRFFAVLSKLSPEEVDHWFRHGVGPIGDAGADLAQRVLVVKPPGLGAMLDALASRDRLAGAAPLVQQLLGALALPPRRRAEVGLPTGGYADIVNRGAIDQILPGQLALDPDEFVRRFASNELLFYHREQPHTATHDELLIFLDQGVRCWGRVRLILASAAIALGQTAVRKKLPWRIGGTSTKGVLLDPAREDPATLGSFWEASDLSLSPSPALETLLENLTEPVARQTDVVVLIHPRSVLRPEFAAATAGLGAGSRLFTVTVNDQGQVALAEWRRGTAIPLASFRVEPFPCPSPTPPKPTERARWNGDIEPIGFPFRLGVADPIADHAFDFDHDGQRLMLATTQGTLHAWTLDGSASEILPQGLHLGERITRIDTVIGVVDGFVVGGCLGSRTLAAVHYDFATRHVRVYRLRPLSGEPPQWFYFRNLQAVMVRGGSSSQVVDLAARTVGEPGLSSDRTSTVADRASRLARGLSLAPPHLAIVNESHPDPGRGGVVRLDPRTGSIQLDRVDPPWQEFTPMTDGFPSLKEHRLEEAQLRGNALAIRVRGTRGGSSPRQYLFCGPTGEGIAEIQTSADRASFQLSSDARWVANQVNDRQILVQAVSGPRRPTLLTPRAMPQSKVLLTLGPMGMALRWNRRARIVAWGSGRLTTWILPESSDRDAKGVEIRDAGPLTVPASRATPLPYLLSNDPDRFVAWARSSLIAVIDRYDQISLLDQDERLIAMLLINQGHLAAWMPDGTRMGPPTLIDGATANQDQAAKALGEALRAASQRATGVRS